MFQLSKEAVKTLAELNITYRITHGQNHVSAAVIDIVTGKVFYTEQAPANTPEEEVVELAIENCRNADRPKSTEQERDALQAEVADLRQKVKELETKTARKAKPTYVPPTPSVPDASTPDE